MLSDRSIEQEASSATPDGNIEQAWQSKFGREILHFHNQGIDDEKIRQLINFLEKQHVKSLYLNNTNNPLLAQDASHNQITSTGLAILAQFLKENATIKYLDLSRNPIMTSEVSGEKNIEGVEALSSALEKNTTLTSLNLSQCDLGDEGAAKLIGVLKVNRTLRTLHLTYNGISDQGMHSISEVLASGKCYPELQIWLAGNEITGDGLTKMFEKMQKMQEGMFPRSLMLHLLDNKIDYEGLHNILVGLKNVIKNKKFPPGFRLDLVRQTAQMTSEISDKVGQLQKLMDAGNKYDATRLLATKTIVSAIAFLQAFLQPFRKIKIDRNILERILWYAMPDQFDNKTKVDDETAQKFAQEICGAKDGQVALNAARDIFISGFFKSMLPPDAIEIETIERQQKTETPEQSISPVLDEACNFGYQKMSAQTFMHIGAGLALAGMVLGLASVACPVLIVPALALLTAGMISAAVGVGLDDQVNKPERQTYNAYFSFFHNNKNKNKPTGGVINLVKPTSERMVLV